MPLLRPSFHLCYLRLMDDLGKIIPMSKEEIEIYLDYDFGFFLNKAFDNFKVTVEDRQIEDAEYRKIREQLIHGFKKHRK